MGDTIYDKTQKRACGCENVFFYFFLKKDYFCKNNQTMVQVHQDASRFIITIPKETDFTEQWFTQLKFQLLAESWKEESRFLAFAKTRTQLMSYQAIIKMGKTVIPYILIEMQQHPNHWFAALKQLTGINPILPEHRGNIIAMTNDWVLWGKKNQII